jgi:AraC-like DNA-binding protein/mannose-6-phosphate isomerase-like protein (cupin superfamily)
MDKNARGWNNTPMLLDQLQPENVSLRLTQRPFKQRQGPSWSIRNRVIDDYDLFVCYGGAALFRVGGAFGNEEFLLEAGHGLLVPPGVVFNAELAGKRHFRAIAQHFTLHLFRSTDFFSLVEYEPIVRFSRWNFVAPLFDEYAVNAMTDNNAMVQYGLVFTVIAEFIHEAYRGDRAPTPEDSSFIVAVANHIDHHLCDETALEDALRLSPFDRATTVRRFRRFLGLSPKAYLAQARMRTAKELLEQGYGVKETAHATGYEDEFYFSRIFKRKTGMSPSAYKEEE